MRDNLLRQGPTPREALIRQNLAHPCWSAQSTRGIAIARGRQESLARQLGAFYSIDNQATDPAEGLRKLGGAKVILATVTSADAMKSVIGGLGINGTFMIIGAVPTLEVPPLQLLGARQSVKGW